MNATTKRLPIVLLAVLVLALSTVAGDAAAVGTTPKRPAGPWYTAQELRALDAYADASFARKQALLAGAGAGRTAAGGSFHWGDAGVGAGAALGTMVAAGVLALLLARMRADRRALRHT